MRLRGLTLQSAELLNLCIAEYKRGQKTILSGILTRPVSRQGKSSREASWILLAIKHLLLGESQLEKLVADDEFLRLA